MIKPTLKICGIKSAEEMALLDAAGIDLAGVWFDIASGEHCLEEAEICDLARHHRSTTEIMLVTTGQNLAGVERLCRQARIQSIQFHGFELPGFIAKARAKLPSATRIYKTLHFKEGVCIEHGLMDRYITAGVDVFIIDSFIDANQIGSTGVPVPIESVVSFISHHKNLSFMLAGGVTATLITQLNWSYPLYGYDIDSAARQHGIICSNKVNEIASAGIACGDSFHQYG